MHLNQTPPLPDPSEHTPLLLSHSQTFATGLSGDKLWRLGPGLRHVQVKKGGVHVVQ